MAKNAFPLILLAGAAFLLTRKKGDAAAPAGEIPEDQGDSSQGGIDASSEEEPTGFSVDWAYDASANLPWVETVGDYQAWQQQLEDTADARDWAGSLEFRDMDEHHADIGIFIEEQMGFFGRTLGRTIDRAELDPEALDAMFESDIGALEKGAAQVFDDLPGLDFMLYFMNDSAPLKLSALFVFDGWESQGASMNKVANFKSAWQSLGLTVDAQVGFIGQENPTLEEKIKAFLNSTLPLKTSVGPGDGPIVGQSLNP